MNKLGKDKVINQNVKNNSEKRSLHICGDADKFLTVK